MDENKDDIVLFKEYARDAEAYMDKGVLETNGVPCVLDNEIMSNIYPMTFAPVRLMVRRADLPLARKIMQMPPIEADED